MVYYKTLTAHKTELYWVFEDRNDVRPSNYHREYSPYGSYSLFQFEGSDVISVLKNSTEYSFVFVKCLLKFVKFQQFRGRRKTLGLCIWSPKFYIHNFNWCLLYNKGILWNVSMDKEQGLSKSSKNVKVQSYIQSFCDAWNWQKR